MESKKLTIFFTSDLHAYIYPTDYRSREERDIGLFKCASRFTRDGNTLIIDGGDLLQGSPLGAFCHDTLQNADPFAEMMNCCGYDYVTLGNHDFNYGMPYLESYLNALRARCVCQNIRWDGAGVRFPACIHTLENGLRIGIVGIVTDYVNIWERPEHLSGITISDPIPAAAAALEELRGKTDLNLCVYHGGFERDLTTGRVLSSTHENVAYRICQELDFDILLTGHQHMSVPGQMVSGTFVVQPSDRGQEFLRIEAVVSGMMARDLAEASAALELSPAAIEAFSAALSTYEGADAEEALHAIRREETRLFIGSDPVVENSEGTWLQRAHGVAHPIRMINNHSVAVADFMKECGVVRKGKYNDCIDYLSNEFDFCGYLADGGTLSVPEDVDAAERLQAFVDEHLCAWVPSFCAEVEAESAEPFYRGLAVLTGEFARALS